MSFIFNTHRLNIVRPIGLKQSALFVLLLSVSLTGGATELNIRQAVLMAQENDLWLEGNQQSQSAIEAQSIAAGALPDPKVSLGLANMPIDSFDFNQEGMTQLKAGISQMFPRGDSQGIKKRQLKLLSTQFPHQRKNRNARVAVTVSQLWLDAYLAQQSIALINADRRLFEDLADIAQASYSSAVGRTRQQDIVRSQLELTRLEDRLTKLSQQQEVAQKKLSQWLSSYFSEQYRNKEHTSNFEISSGIELSKELPDIDLQHAELLQKNTQNDRQLLAEYFSKHPAVKSLEQKILASKVGIELVEQKYKPEWGMNASYGYRGDDPMGNDRADFVSVGISFDLPVFTSNRQDQQLQSEIAKTEAIKTEKWLLLRNMMSAFEVSKARLVRLNQRKTLYESQLLPQTHEQAEASLSAYTNDDGDFAEVVRARIAELNANIDKLAIDVERQKTIVQLNFFFTNDDINQSNFESSPVANSAK